MLFCMKENTKFAFLVEGAIILGGGKNTNFLFL